VRIDFEFTGIVSTPLSLDPAEFKGATIPEITALVLQTLHGIDARVSFFEDDARLAAETLHEEASLDAK